MRFLSNGGGVAGTAGKAFRYDTIQNNQLMSYTGIGLGSGLEQPGGSGGSSKGT